MSSEGDCELQLSDIMLHGVSLSLDVFVGCLWDQKVSPD